MNKRKTTTASFAGFLCKRCGGRVFEDDPYWDGNGRKTAVLQCLLCSRETFCPWKEYKHLVDQIESIIKRKNKNLKGQVLFPA